MDFICRDRCPCKKMDFGQTCRGKRPWEAKTRERDGAGRSDSLSQAPEVGREEEGEYIVVFAAAMFVVLCHGSSRKVMYPFDEEVGSVIGYLGS